MKNSIIEQSWKLVQQEGTSGFSMRKLAKCVDKKKVMALSQKGISIVYWEEVEAVLEYLFMKDMKHYL